METNLVELISKIDKSDSETPKISTRTYKSLFTDFQDERLDFLFMGINKDGECIIGSLINECDDLSSYLYFHTVVSKYTFKKFMSREITLKDAMKYSFSIWITVASWTNEEKSFYPISFVNIPKDIMPLNDSFYPTFCENIQL